MSLGFTLASLLNRVLRSGIAPETLRKIEVLYDEAYMGPVHYLDDEELPRRSDCHHS
jgi:hypothetical protein